MFNETCGFEGLGALHLEVDNYHQFVGQAPFYRITGATPGNDLFWDSTKNGVSTGEVLSGYGHKADANGNWSGWGGKWEAAHLGSWTKTIHDGASGPTATAPFQVIQPPAQQGNQGGQTIYYTGPAAPRPDGDDTLDIFGMKIPKTVAIIGAAGAFWLFTRKK
jgi:hypothetical protein